MKKPIVPLLILAVLFCSVHGLERKRTKEETQCSVSATGEKVCTPQNLDSREDGNENSTEEIYFDDDEYNEVEEKEEDDCTDTHASCNFWASEGECAKNPNYMLKGCPVSCNSCPNTLVKGLTVEQNQEKPTLLDEIAKYGKPQDIAEDTQDRTMLVIRKTVDYMKNYIYAENPTHKIPKETVDACTNNHELCSYWASIGECEENPAYLVTKCAPACLSCHKIDYNMRCGNRDPSLQPGLKPGEMNLMFQRIVDNAPGNVSDATQLAAQKGRVQEDGTPVYTVTVHSSPTTRTPPVEENGVISLDKETDAKEAPWVITFDNFLTDEECKYLIQLGYKNGYKRSTDVGRKQIDGSYGTHQSQGRTSENSWCDPKSGCRQDPVVQRVMQRLSNVTGVPSDNYEDLQLLKYDVGQFYRSHHDFIRHQKDRHSGPRILTFFLYLSDVEEGGGTLLNDLGIEIKPKTGRALLWPSTMSWDPSEKDHRTRHEALAVEKGLKFAANAWIHLFNNVEASKQGCN